MRKLIYLILGGAVMLPFCTGCKSDEVEIPEDIEEVIDTLDTDTIVEEEVIEEDYYDSTALYLDLREIDPTIWGNNTIDTTTMLITMEQYGFAGLHFNTPLDVSEYKYMVIELEEEGTTFKNYSVMLRVFSTNSYFSTCSNHACSQFRTVIELDDQEIYAQSEGFEAFDPSKIYYIGWWTGGTTTTIQPRAIYFTNVYPPMDDEEEETYDYLTFTNPVMYADMPDPSIVRVGDDYYMVSTTMHFSPAVAVLHSRDMVGWEIVGHVYHDDIGKCPAASFGTCSDCTVNGHTHNNHVFNEEAGNYKNDIYAEGSWASSLAYNPKDGYFYCLWNIMQDDISYISRTKDPAGDWEIICQCYPVFYDSSLFFDDDGTAYIARAHNENIWQLPADLDLNNAVAVYDFSSDRGSYDTTEGYHMFKVENYYYISMVQWLSTGACILLRSESPTGPFAVRKALEGFVVSKHGNYVSSGGVAQGRIIDVPSDEEDRGYYGFFACNMGPVGRAPVIADIQWSPRAMPIFGNDGESVDEVMKAPVQKYGTVSSSVIAKSDNFTGSKLDPVWEWNHTPDNTNWTLTGSALRLTTGHVATDFFHARNTVTQRTVGPICYGQITMDVSNMKNGDFAGLGMMQYRTGLVGVKKRLGKTLIYMAKGIQDYGKYECTFSDNDYVGAMKEYATVQTTATTVTVRVEANFKTNYATFYYLDTDGSWTQIGEKMLMTYSLINFVGNRFAIYNYATTATGGYVDIQNFTFEQ